MTTYLLPHDASMSEFKTFFIYIIVPILFIDEHEDKGRCANCFFFLKGVSDRQVELLF